MDHLFKSLKLVPTNDTSLNINGRPLITEVIQQPSKSQPSKLPGVLSTPPKNILGGSKCACGILICLEPSASLIHTIYGYTITFSLTKDQIHE